MSQFVANTKKALAMASMSTTANTSTTTTAATSLESPRIHPMLGVFREDCYEQPMFETQQQQPPNKRGTKYPISMHMPVTSATISTTTTAATSLESPRIHPMLGVQTMFDTQQRQQLNIKGTTNHPTSMPIPVTSATVSTTTTAAPSLDSPRMGVFRWNQNDDKDDRDCLSAARLHKSTYLTAKPKLVEENIDSVDEDYRIGQSAGLSIDTMNSYLPPDSPKSAVKTRRARVATGGLGESERSMTSIIESPRLFGMESPGLSPRPGEELLIFGDLEL